MFDGERYYGMEVLSIETYQDFRQNTELTQPGSLAAAGYAFHGELYNSAAFNTTSGNRVPKEHTTWIRTEYTTDNGDILNEAKSQILASYDKKIIAYAESNPNDGNPMPAAMWETSRSDCTDGAGNGTMVTAPFIFCNFLWQLNVTPDELGNGVDPLYPYTYGWIRMRTRIRFRMRQVGREDFLQNKH